MYNATYSAHYHFLGLIFVFWKTSPINSTWPKASHSETSAEWAASAHALSAVSFMWPILLCLTRRHLPWQTIGDSDVLTVLHCFWGGEFFLILILLPKPVLDLTSSQYRVLFYHLYTALHERHNLGVGHVWVSDGQQYCDVLNIVSALACACLQSNTYTHHILWPWAELNAAVFSFEPYVCLVIIDITPQPYALV